MIGILLGIFLQACSVDGKCEEKKFIEQNREKIEKVRREFEWLKNQKREIEIKIDERKIEEVKKRFEKLKKVDEKLIEKFKDALLTSQGQQRVWELFFSKPIKKEKEKKKVIFYLFSRSVPSSTVENVFESAKKLKDYEFYGVLMGIDKKTLSYLSRIEPFREGKITVKINPLIFEKVGAKVVPAFVLADCKKEFGILRTRSCEFKAVMFGDTSLEFFLKKLKEVEK